MRLLIVEDDQPLANALSAALLRRGFDSDIAAGFEDARQMLAAARYGFVLLDLGLPDGDGIALVKQLRALQDPIPVIVTTARDAIGDRIAGLNAGADDYVVKPFDVDELVARILAILRRQDSFVGTRLSVGNLSFDTLSGEVLVDNRRVALSRRELQLAGLLMRRAGQLVSKQLVEDQLYGLSEPIGSNAVEVYVHRLRRRLEAASAHVRIETVRGLGYMLRPSP